MPSTSDLLAVGLTTEVQNQAVCQGAATVAKSSRKPTMTRCPAGHIPVISKQQLSVPGAPVFPCARQSHAVQKFHWMQDHGQGHCEQSALAPQLILRKDRGIMRILMDIGG